jgi:hypothetical protein
MREASRSLHWSINIEVPENHEIKQVVMPEKEEVNEQCKGIT